MPAVKAQEQEIRRQSNSKPPKIAGRGDGHPPHQKSGRRQKADQKRLVILRSESALLEYFFQIFPDHFIPSLCGYPCSVIGPPRLNRRHSTTRTPCARR